MNLVGPVNYFISTRAALKVTKTNTSKNHPLIFNVIRSWLFDLFASFYVTTKGASLIAKAVRFQTMGLYDKMEVYARSALETAPYLPEAHKTMGNSHFIRSRFLDAETSYLRAISLNPDYADAFYNLGSTFLKECRPEKAEFCYKRAINIQPDHMLSLVALSDIFSSRGHFDEAEAYLQRALKINPTNPAALATLAGLRKMTSNDATWLSTAQAVAKSNLGINEEAGLHFSMGKYCDDVHDFDRAFQYYSHANNLLKEITLKYDRQAHTRVYDQLIHAYNKKRISQVSADASASMRPVFIVGMERSGTTLIEQIISSHPAAFGAGELVYWCDAFKEHEQPILDAAVGQLLLSKLADDYLQTLSRLNKDAICVVDKMPGNFIVLGLIHLVFPNARVIHAQRNPIDTCLSNYFQNFSTGHNHTNDLGDLSHYYREYRRLMAHWREVLPADAILDVPYEALVQGQEVWSRRIVDFIGLDWDDRCLNFHQTARKVETASNWQVRQKIYKTSVGRWRNYEKYIDPLMGLMDLQ